MLPCSRPQQGGGIQGGAVVVTPLWPVTYAGHFEAIRLLVTSRRLRSALLAPMPHPKLVALLCLALLLWGGLSHPSCHCAVRHHPKTVTNSHTDGKLCPAVTLQLVMPDSCLSLRSA